MKMIIAEEPVDFYELQSKMQDYTQQECDMCKANQTNQNQYVSNYFKTQYSQGIVYKIMSWFHSLDDKCLVCESSDEDNRKLSAYFNNLIQKTPMFSIQLKEEQINKFAWADFDTFDNLTIAQKEWNEKNEMIYRIKETERAEHFKYLITQEPRLI